MKPKGVTRRQAVVLASGVVAAAAIPSAILSAASAASPQPTPIEPVEVDRLLRLVAHQQEPAWNLWQATAREFAPLMARARELAACRDMDELLAFRLGEAVIAFDMASRRIARLALMTTWSEPRNESERAIKDRAESCRAFMQDAETHQVWMTLSRHIASLQKEGLRAKGHVYLRQQQERRQHEISRTFEREYGPKTMA
jgi:hypothetical protein